MRWLSFTIVSSIICKFWFVESSHVLPTADHLVDRFKHVNRRDESSNFPKNGTIELTGIGRVDVYTDLTKLSFAIYRTENCDISNASNPCMASEAQKRLNKATDKVVTALLKEESVVGVYTEGMNFEQSFEFYSQATLDALKNDDCPLLCPTDNSGNQKEVLVAYKSKVELLVITKTIDQGKIIDLAIKNGVNVILDISNYISPNDYDQANVDAVKSGAQDALDQATAILKSLPEGPIETLVTRTEKIDILFSDDPFTEQTADIANQQPVFNDDGIITGAYKTISYQVSVRLRFTD